jgi:alkylmercury lyase
MSYERAAQTMKLATKDGGFLDFGPDRSRLLLEVMRRLAGGRTVSRDEVDRVVHEVGIAHDEADRFLAQWAERDADNNIRGIFGLSLNPTTHRVSVDGAQLWGWCAGDTFEPPLLLQQRAVIESAAPASGNTVHLTVSSEQVEEVQPPGAVMSMIVIDPNAADMSSVQAIWGSFCHHVHFFPSREEAEQWAAGRDEIEIISVEEGFELVRQVAARILSYTQSGSGRPPAESRPSQAY